MGELSEMKKDGARKNSVMLPNGASSFNDSAVGKTGGSLAAAGSNVIGGIDNYKRYQMLVASQKAETLMDGHVKRSQSLLGDSKKYPLKRTVTMNDGARSKKITKLS